MVDDMGMRRRVQTVLVAAGTLLPLTRGEAQMHEVEKPEQVVRAVGVYEWTGDLKKPTASRLVPVTVFINGQLEDAGIYLPRPIPFALTSGNEYVLEQAGLAKGELDLAYATHLQTANADYEDGWFGYGSFKTPPPPKKEPALRASKTPAVVTSSKDDARPHFGGRSDTSGESTKGDSTPAGKDPQGTSAGGSSGSGDDADRPTMRRRSDSTDGSTTSTDSTSSANDPDRPTLRRRSPEEEKKAKKAKDTATVTGVGSLNDDPDRPTLHRGGHSTDNDSDIAKLVGVPKDLKQMVAISDAANRAPHDFTRAWENDAERATVLGTMQAMAQAQLAAYPVAGAPAAAATPAATSAAKPKPATTVAARRSALAAKRAAAKAAAGKPAQVLLTDESLKAYTLSYGGAATYVYTAHTAGTGADLRYVTVVAQADVTGKLRPAIQSVTDDQHLDRTPQMRFVDVVDAEASNRASLLFELRAQTTRQFALLRVIGSRPDTIFTTGTTQ